MDTFAINWQNFEVTLQQKFAFRLWP